MKTTMTVTDFLTAIRHATTLTDLSTIWSAMQDMPIGTTHALLSELINTKAELINEKEKNNESSKNDCRLHERSQTRRNA